jgi:hypothetical protein
MSPLSVYPNSIESQLEEVSGAVLTPIRWVVLLGILASYQLKFGLQHRVDQQAVLATVAVYAALAAVLPHLRGRPFTPRAVTRLLLAADLLFSAAVFHFSDGIRSPYFGLWYLAMIHAALVLEMRASMALAAGTAALVVAHECLLPAGQPVLPDMDMAIGKLPFLLLIA